jgi:cell division protein FtsI/penicillin-binding protein 2
MGETGAEIIGFLNSKNNGISGLEKYYNKILSRDFHKKNNNLFSQIFFTNFSDIFKKKEVYREGDLYTSIDLNTQRYLEDLLSEITKKYHSKISFGVIMRPSNGEIIAMSSSNKFNFNKTKKDYRNNIVEGRYEPGSIIKPLVLAAALDSNSINTNFKYNDTGCLFVEKDKICNYDEKARGPNTDLVRVIRESLNVGMVRIEQKIKNKDLFKYYLDFGFSEESGIDLPNEISQNINSLNYNIPINYATAAFGQGVSISPIGMIRALAILANGGYLVSPHIVNSIKYNSKIPDYEFEEERKKILKDKTIFDIEDIMVKAVETSPTKRQYKPK